MHEKSVKFVIIGILKILILNMNHIFPMVVIVQCKKLLVIMILLLFMFREVLTEFTFGTWVKDDTISIMNNSNLNDKIRVFFFFFLILYIKNE